MSSEQPTHIVVAALIERQEQFLIAQRRLTDRFPGLWEFPGGKLERGESPEEALRRECREELAVEVEVRRIREVLFHPYDSFSVLLLFYDCEIVAGEPQALDCERLEWAAFDKLEDYEFLPADKPLIRRLGRAGS